MISCSSCAKQNQDHYRFCLGCGAELSRGTAAKPEHAIEDPTTLGSGVAVSTRSASPVTRSASPVTRSAVGSSAPRSAAPQAAPAAMPVAPAPMPVAPESPPGLCPECKTDNPPSNRFCASCGCKLEAKKAVLAPSAKPVTPVETSGVVLVALDAEGNDIGRHELPRGESFVGRETGGVFGNDAFLSPKHARFVANDGRVTVGDAASLNGVFRKLLAEQRAPLKPGQCFRIGQELLVFETLSGREADADGVVHQGAALDGVIGRVSLVIGRKTRAPSVPIPAHGLHFGRERGDVTFADDGYVSGLHCRVNQENGEVFVTDLGSSNGTFVQLLGDHELKNGDILLMGQQLFRVTL